MSIMNKILILTILYLIYQHEVSGDITETKKNALTKIDELMNRHKSIVNETLTALPSREANLNVISKHVRETGDELLKSTHSSIHRTAISGYMMRSLLGSSEDVIKCIEFKENENRKEAERYFTNKFDKPATDYENEADKLQSDDIKAWVNEYNAVVLQFTEIYERTLADIRESNDTDEIQRIVYDFSRNQREMERIVGKVNVYMSRLQIQFLQILENLVNDIRITLQIRVDKAMSGIRDCFDGILLRKMMENAFFKINNTIE